MSEMPQLPDGMYWSAGIYPDGKHVDVYLNMSPNDPRHKPPYSERRELCDNWTEDGLVFAVIDAAHALMARIKDEIERRAIVERVSARLNDLPILRAGV